MNIVVATTPFMQEADRAIAANCLQNNGGNYYEHIPGFTANAQPGDFVFYVESGFLRGYCVLLRAVTDKKEKESLTGKKWSKGTLLVMDSTTWKWVKPQKLPEFSRYKIMPQLKFEILGSWRDPYPGKGLPNTCPHELANSKDTCIYPYCKCQWLF